MNTLREKVYSESYVLVGIAPDHRDARCRRDPSHPGHEVYTIDCRPALWTREDAEAFVEVNQGTSLIGDYGSGDLERYPLVAVPYSLSPRLRAEWERDNGPIDWGGGGA